MRILFHGLWVGTRRFHHPLVSGTVVFRFLFRLRARAFNATQTCKLVDLFVVMYLFHYSCYRFVSIQCRNRLLVRDLYVWFRYIILLRRWLCTHEMRLKFHRPRGLVPVSQPRHFDRCNRCTIGRRVHS